MKAESLTLFIEEASCLESKLLGLMDKLNGAIRKTTYKEIEEQVRQMKEAIRELRGILVNL